MVEKKEEYKQIVYYVLYHKEVLLRNKSEQNNLPKLPMFRPY